ncbi:hypothetical protein SBOR_9177 [Sclerotinia borealis F-4128]|uniref:Uncharacterized protein n=1 Tax=Sclerotinia borealis (strain F-4128) TaxID=1432307 RepID=W9C6B2_SCLBF|nr:hypothetical protein SBOR_9177 [Sclerotinia borealis F-4128]
MMKETLLVVLRYSKDKGGTIQQILNNESVVARRGVNNKPKVGCTVPRPALPTRRNSWIAEALSQINRVLRHVDDEKKVMRYLLVLRETLQSLTDILGPTEREMQTQKDQCHNHTKEEGSAAEIKPAVTIAQNHHKDFETRITELIEENKKLRAENETSDRANNNLECTVDANEFELSALKNELGQIRQNESQLEGVKEQLRSSPETTNKAFEMLSSFTEIDKYQESVLQLEGKLKACQAEREEVLNNSKRQNESWEKKHMALVNENKNLEKKMAGLKRKLGDVIEDIDDGTPSKRRQGTASSYFSCS